MGMMRIRSRRLLVVRLRFAMEHTRDERKGLAMMLACAWLLMNGIPIN
jgi:hypothetical protein